MIRTVLVAGLLLGAIASADAQTTLRVGDQKGNSQAVMEAAGVLRDVPYKIEWKEFPAAAPLLEALSAGAIETGLVGDAPFTFAAAANVPVKAIAAIRQSREGLAVLVQKDSAVRDFESLRGKKIATGRGSIGHQLILAALESKRWSTSDEKGKVRVLASARDVHATNAFFLANKDFTGAHQDIVALLNQTFAQESKWADQHRSEIVKTLHEATSFDTEALDRAVNRSQFGVTPLTDKIIASQQATADRFLKLGLIPKPINVKDIVWNWTPGS